MHNAIRKYGESKFIINLLAIASWDKYLKDLEIKAIDIYNTLAPNGYNLTTGGDGIPKPTKEVIEKIKIGRKLNPPVLTEYGRKAISEASKIAWSNSEHKSKRSQAIKNGLNDKDVHKARCLAISKSASTENGRKIKQEVAKKLWLNDEYREKVNRLAKIGMNTEEGKRNRSIAAKLRWERERNK